MRDFRVVCGVPVAGNGGYAPLFHQDWASRKKFGGRSWLTVAVTLRRSSGADRRRDNAPLTQGDGAFNDVQLHTGPRIRRQAHGIYRGPG